MRIEDLAGDRHQCRVSNPGPVVTVGRLAKLVRPHLAESLLVGLGIILDGDLGGHASHGVNTAAVAGANEKLCKRPHAGLRHRHLAAVGQHPVRPRAEGLHDAENVVPATAVETGRMFAQLIEDLVHLEGSRQRLQEHGRLDGATGNVQVFLRSHEDLVPEACLQVSLELGEVEIGPASPGNQVSGIVEQEQAKVEEPRRNGPAVDQYVPLEKVPAARPDHENGGLVVEPVVLAVAAAEADRARHRVAEVDLAGAEVLPRRRVGVLEVGHEHVGTAVETVDDHLPIDRTGDLDTPIEQVVGKGSNRPVGGPDRPGLGQKARLLAAVELPLTCAAIFQQFVHSTPEPPRQRRDELHRTRAQDRVVALAHRTKNGDPRRRCGVACMADHHVRTPSPLLQVQSCPAVGGTTGRPGTPKVGRGIEGAQRHRNRLGRVRDPLCPLWFRITPPQGRARNASEITAGRL